jgi:hypothetical protein
VLSLLVYWLKTVPTSTRTDFPSEVQRNVVSSYHVRENFSRFPSACPELPLDSSWTYAFLGLKNGMHIS